MWSYEKTEWQQEEDEFGFGSLNRMLGGDESDYVDEGYDKKGVIPLDYKVLNYGIFTLYLILFVEFVRHTIDRSARGRPFFMAVLLMVYSELATLGIVELGVFFYMKYGSIEKEKKKKFADVHFALFLTAIFNALQYSLTSIVSTRLSNGLWVKTEQLELDHYVEIREEYERVQGIIDLQYTGCGKWVRNFFLFVFRLRLRRRHESLRVQVRFHELRLHFLESNKLSFSLKVSDYLKRSELSILIGLVHVSVTTWVLLIGILNIGYFIFGMIGYTTSNPEYIVLLMTILFFAIDVLFIVLSLALRWKMRQIFQTVMKTKVIETSDREEGIKNQNQLFWFGSPPLVISMIQLMNFGYAVSISFVIIYWNHLNNKISGVRAEIYLVMSLGCYIIFLYNLSALLPEYTLCTSLGYLTNQKELHETVATHRLEEVERQRRNRIIENAAVNDSTIFQAFPVAKSNSAAQNTGDVSLRNAPTSVFKSSVGAMSDDKDKKAPLLVSDLVKIDTKALRRNLPEESRENLRNREERLRERRSNRKKSISDGVATMRAWNQGNGKSKNRKKSRSDPRAIQGWKESLLLEKGQIRKKSRSDPLAIQGWKESLLLEKGKIHNEEKNEDSVPKWEKDRLNRLAVRKRTRRKSQSASAVVQSWQDHSARESTTENFGAIVDENYNSSDLRALSSGDGSCNDIFTSKMKASHFYEKKTDKESNFVKLNFNLQTLREIEDHSQVFSLLGDDAGATSDRKTILDLSHAVIINDRTDCNDDDDNTIDTGKSIGNLSDIDVIHAEIVGIVSYPKKSSRTVEREMSWYAVIIRDVRLYLIGSTYPNMSHVVGTSIVFYLIGRRVQVMLTKAESTNNNESLLIEIACFWLEAMFFLLFIMADFIILVLFPICKCKTETERRLGLATMIDIIIVGIVLMLFFVAEAQRCCTKQSEGTSSVYEIGEDYLFESDCTCPRWGARTYGGLGVIEPFTSIIVLRLFRFQFAQFLINSFNQKRDMDETTNDSKSNPNTQYQTNIGREIISGSALELWERAIAEFPDIVQKYGQFSGELLQAMLGLEVAMESSGVSVSKKSYTSETEKDKMKNLRKCENMKSHIKLAQSRYAKLPPRAQGIVIAGSLRKPVKPMYPEVCEKAGIEPSPASLSRTGLVDFEIDNERMHSEHNTSYTFIAPFARLVRSMRRCDRRHLPLLKGWISVDVVMTQFEIVYFEAIDSYNSDLDENTRIHCEACRLALKATKGGKDLRLCDVALGRKVVGHLDFADVTEVVVARDDQPISDMTLVEKAAVLFDKEQDLDVEHWSKLYSETEANQKYARIIRWTLIQEERLKISTNSGTLYFRFYSDLAFFGNGNSEPPNNSHAIARDIAFQWAGTISRICGRSQLQQNLPHFGEENEAELRDYLKVVHFHEKEAGNEIRNSSRGVQNIDNVERLFVGTKECDSAKKKVKHKRIKSLIEFGSAVSTLKQTHRKVESMSALGNVTQPQQNEGHGKDLSLNGADYHV